MNKINCQWMEDFNHSELKCECEFLFRLWKCEFLLHSTRKNFLVLVYDHKNKLRLKLKSYHLGVCFPSIFRRDDPPIFRGDDPTIFLGSGRSVDFPSYKILGKYAWDTPPIFQTKTNGSFSVYWFLHLYFSRVLSSNKWLRI